MMRGWTSRQGQFRLPGEAMVCNDQLISFLLLQDGQLVTFSEVDGLPGLNDKKPRRIQNVKVRITALDSGIVTPIVAVLLADNDY